MPQNSGYGAVCCPGLTAPPLLPGYNSDNGALHWLLLHRLWPREGGTQGDVELFEAAAALGRTTGLQDQRPGTVAPSYMGFLAAFHDALASTDCVGGDWDHIALYPPGKGWFYDGYVRLQARPCYVAMHGEMACLGRIDYLVGSGKAEVWEAWGTKKAIN